MTAKTCIKCGGSWAGAVQHDPMCQHDFDEPPEPDGVIDDVPLRRLGDDGVARALEVGFCAFGPAPGGNRLRGPWIEEEHPTREGAIAAWKDAWRKRHEEMRQAAWARCVERGTPDERLAEELVAEWLEAQRDSMPSAEGLAASVAAQAGILDARLPPAESMAGTLAHGRVLADGSVFYETQADFVDAIDRDIGRTVVGTAISDSVPDPDRPGHELVTVRLFAPGAVMTEAERGAAIAAAMGVARREFNRPLAPCAGCGTVHEPQEGCVEAYQKGITALLGRQCIAKRAAEKLADEFCKRHGVPLAEPKAYQYASARFVRSERAEAPDQHWADGTAVRVRLRDGWCAAVVLCFDARVGDHGLYLVRLAGRYEGEQAWVDPDNVELASEAFPVGARITANGHIGHVEEYRAERGIAGQYACRFDDDRPAVWVDARLVELAPEEPKP